MSSDSIKHTSKEPLHAVHISQGLSILRCLEKLRKGENACAAGALIKYGNGRLLLMNLTVIMVNHGMCLMLEWTADYMDLNTFHNVAIDVPM